MKSEGLDNIVLAAYSRSQRVSRVISLVVTVMTIVVGASLVAIAAVTTARYYAVKNENERLNLEIKDLTERLLTAQNQNPPNGKPSESRPGTARTPVAATPTPIQPTPEKPPATVTPTPCPEGADSAELERMKIQISRLNEELKSCQSRLNGCLSRPTTPVKPHPGAATVKTPSGIQ